MRELAMILVVLTACGERAKGHDSDALPPDSMSPPMEEVSIPSGSFQMGSPANEPGRIKAETQHLVTLTRAFKIQAHEVTQGDWLALSGTNPAAFQGCGADCPIESIDWYASLAYANALSDRAGLERCYELVPTTCADAVADWASGDTSCTDATFVGLDCTGYRLPTAAEWEYAYRAGTTTAFYNGPILFGDSGCEPDANLDAIGTYCESLVSYADCVDTRQFGGQLCAGTHPVRQSAPNAWGLYDMAGNVWEYVWDWHGPYAGGAETDPLGPVSGTLRVIRGGSWHNFPLDERAARHNGADGGPSVANYARGFRLARTN